jgi:hypothetical protein
MRIFEVPRMTVLLAATLLTAISASPAPSPTPRTRTPIASQAVANALDPKHRVIEVIAVGNAEDGAPGGTNVVELGRVSYWPAPGAAAAHPTGRRSEPFTLVRRVVTVRIGTERTGFAPLRAALQTDDGRCRIRVDGKTLTVATQVIDALAPLGKAVAHVIEIEIPTSVPEGPIAASISWTSDPR